MKNLLNSFILAMMMTNGHQNSRSQAYQTIPPALSYLGKTPVAKGRKRGCTELSPVTENPDANLEAIIQNAVRNAIPDIMAQMQQQLEASIALAVQDSLATFKQQVKTEMVDHENRCYLKTLSESDMYEPYNGRDNVKIFNLKMDDGKTREEYNETIDKVLDVIDRVESVVEASDISIAHRLPGKRNPIIVKFNRRVAKQDLLKKKKKLAEVDDMNYISVVEDITRPRLSFLNIMKTDNRIKSAWVREGVLHYMWNNDTSVYKIFGSSEGGSVLNYPLSDVLACFNGVFPPHNNSQVS